MDKPNPLAIEQREGITFMGLINRTLLLIEQGKGIPYTLRQWANMHGYCGYSRVDEKIVSHYGFLLYIFIAICEKLRYQRIDYGGDNGCKQAIV